MNNQVESDEDDKMEDYSEGALETLAGYGNEKAARVLGQEVGWDWFSDRVISLEVAKLVNKKTIRRLTKDAEKNLTSVPALTKLAWAENVEAIKAVQTLNVSNWVHEAKTNCDATERLVVLSEFGNKMARDALKCLADAGNEMAKFSLQNRCFAKPPGIK